MDAFCGPKETGFWSVADRFAAEIFRDLHDELMAIGGRGHDLTVRVQQLEAELPAVEKALLSEPNQLRFAYSNGMYLAFETPVTQKRKLLCLHLKIWVVWF